MQFVMVVPPIRYGLIIKLTGVHGHYLGQVLIRQRLQVHLLPQHFHVILQYKFQLPQ